MNTVLLIVQIVLSLILVVLIVLQSRGGGLGSAFGGSLAAYSTRRGVEKAVHRATIVISILFFISSIVQLVI
jgi:preprotein translocase subunit SecG